MTGEKRQPGKMGSVAWRVHAAFLIAVAVPTLLLALVSFFLVQETLEKKALREAHQLSRDLGMAVYERLKFVTDELRILRLLDVGTVNDLLRDDALNIAESLVSIFYLAADDTTRGPVDLSAAERQSLLDQLATRKRDAVSVITVRVQASRVFLLVPRVDAPGALIAAEIDTRQLWSTGDLHGRPERVCLLDAERLPLYCNHAPSARWRERSEPLLQARYDPRSVVDDAGSPLLTAAWSIFLAAGYQSPGWQILVGVPETLGLATARGFAYAFSGIAALAFLLAFWLGTRMIRANLDPLGKLRAALDDFSQGRLEQRLDIRSGDEFEQIADAFNDMTRQIDAQFNEQDSLTRLYRKLQRAKRPEPAIFAAAEALRDMAGSDFALVFTERWRRSPAITILPRGASALVTLESADVNPSVVGHAASGAFPQLVVTRGYLRQLELPYADSEHAGVLRCISVCNTEDIGCEIVWSDGAEQQHEVLVRVASLLGITLESLAVSRRLAHLAHHDWLSGLPNRIELRRVFEAQAELAHESDASIGMLLIDINRFKQVNDSMGHTLGDGLLVQIAGRLRDTLPADCLLSRMTGDEFVVMLPADSAPVSLARMEDMAEALLAGIAKPFRIGLRELQLSASISGAMYPQHGRKFEVMLQSLDVAMSAAKTAAARRLLVFSHSMREQETNRWEVEQALTGAVSNGELVLHYQPIVEARSGRVRSAEALMRWHRPGVGLEMPGAFIGIAEASGLINDMGRWAIHEVCRQAGQWRDRGLKFDSVSVNVSSRQLADDNIIRHVRDALAQSGIAPQLLTLEVTETSFIDKFDDTVERLGRLRELGVQVLIDDFGTGYASLKYLKMLPVDGLKIDRLFIKNLARDTIDESIVAAIVNLAQHSGYKLVAEGVETEAQAVSLKMAGVPLLQGYLFDRPLEADDLAQRMIGQVAWHQIRATEGA